MRPLPLICITLLFLIFGSCSETSKQDGALPGVGVLVEPYRYIVEQIAGDRVTVSVLVPEGSEPHSYTPTPLEVERLLSSEVYFKVAGGHIFPVEDRLIASSGKIQIIDLGQSVPARKADSHGHKINDIPNISEVSVDPHIWLGIPQVRVQALLIAEALCEIESGHTGEFMENLSQFQARLDLLEKDLGEMLQPLKGNSVFVFHPAFGYFLDSFGITQHAIEADGKEPGPAELEAILNSAREAEAKVLFVEPQFSQRTAGIVASAIGAQVMVIDPLAYDWEDNMRRIGQSLLPGSP